MCTSKPRSSTSLSAPRGCLFSRGMSSRRRCEPSSRSRWRGTCSPTSSSTGSSPRSRGTRRWGRSSCERCGSSSMSRAPSRLARTRPTQTRGTRLTPSFGRGRVPRPSRGPTTIDPRHSNNGPHSRTRMVIDHITHVASSVFFVIERVLFRASDHVGTDTVRLFVHRNVRHEICSLWLARVKLVVLRPAPAVRIGEGSRGGVVHEQRAAHNVTNLQRARPPQALVGVGERRLQIADSVELRIPSEMRVAETMNVPHPRRHLRVQRLDPSPQKVRPDRLDQIGVVQEALLGAELHSR
mmetsp:Transcript_28510/g.93151  ORF Transcript_28510/g.93151 Transcript_28510/m.93151 type:complete len:296 (-) Transcript_28510:671-1558(-)